MQTPNNYAIRNEQAGKDHTYQMCKYCLQEYTFQYPKFPERYTGGRGPYGQSVPIPQDEWNTAYAEYRRAYAEMEKAFGEHLKEKHNIKECPHCGTYCTGVYFKKHTKSIDCTIDQRQRILKSRGLVQSNIIETSYIPYIQHLGYKLALSSPWDDNTSRLMARDLAEDAKRLFRKLGGVTPALTGYRKNASVNHDHGWYEEDWLPQDTAQALTAIEKMYPEDKDLEARNREAWFWLLSDDFQRECQLGGYELAGERFDF